MKTNGNEKQPTKAEMKAELQAYQDGEGSRAAARKLHILRHSLGLDKYGHGSPYRNRFVTGPGTTDWPDCTAMVDEGLMVRISPTELTGGDYCFVVTDAGREYVAIRRGMLCLPAALAPARGGAPGVLGNAR